MKKLTLLALLAIVVMAAPAFAARSSRLGLAPNATFAAGAPTTTNNDDSCDIGVAPAATLLLPYFEVDPTAGGATTLFTITNTSRFPQIAHVTIWTDWSAPVLDFNLWLTGYDVQSLNLYDIIFRGLIAPPNGARYTTVEGTPGPNVTGATPGSESSNVNIVAGASTSCANIPGTLPGGQGGAIQAAVASVLQTGRTSALCAGDQIGGNHAGSKAIGYVTVDVSANCTNFLPTDPTYYTSPNGILYDNTLIGDYQQIGPAPAGSAGTGFDGAGNAMVHIRAIPEGGAAGSAPGTNLPFTFYNRYSNTGGGTPGLDRRQPLPSTWAARWIGGTVTGATYATDYKIWREGVTGANENCDVADNSSIAVTSVVRFDEHENSLGFGTDVICSPFCVGGGIPPLPETSRVAAGTANNSNIAGTFPTLPASGFTSGDVGGWMYLNLSSGGVGGVAATGGGGTPAAADTLTFSSLSPTAFGPAPDTRTTTQNWVVISMFGNVGTQRLAADFDAAWLGNGCTPAPAAGATIGPAANVTP